MATFLVADEASQETDSVNVAERLDAPKGVSIPASAKALGIVGSLVAVVLCFAALGLVGHAPGAESAKVSSVNNFESLVTTPTKDVGFNIKYIDTKLTKTQVEPIVKSWVYWDPSAIHSFFNHVDSGFCNIMIHAPPAKGWTAKGGEAVFTFCGREKFEKITASWDSDSSKKKKKNLGDLEPPPVTVAGSTITLVEDWYGGPDVNGGNPVKETVVMVLNNHNKVQNIIYSVDNPYHGH